MKIKRLIKEVKTFLSEEEGLTIVEYAVGGALIAAGAVAAFTNLGTAVCVTVDKLDDAVKGIAISGSCPTS